MRDKRLETKLRLLTLQLDNVLQRGVSIRGLRELSNDEVRRLETEWNAVFTKLSVVQGQLKAQRKELAGQTVYAYHLNRLFRRLATAR